MFCTKCGAQNTPGVRFCMNCGNPLGTAVGSFAPPQTTTTAGAASSYATWASRVIAYLIDFALVAAVMAVLYIVAGSFFGAIASLGHGADGLAGGGCCMMLLLFPVATLIVGIYNRVYLVAQRGYSIGQGIMKLKVVDASGNLLSIGTLVVRLLAQAVIQAIPIIGLLDVLWPLWDPTRQTLHDKAVGSFVINNPAQV